MKLFYFRRFKWGALASVVLGCALPLSALANVSARTVLKTEQGWRLPALGEDISNAVFYPSWFVGLGVGDARLREHRGCDFEALSIGNHFGPSWQWQLSAAQCQTADAPSEDYASYNLKLERLLAEAETPLNAFVGLGILGRDHTDLPFASAQEAAASVNVGAHWRGKGRWVLRAEHTESAERYRQTSLTLMAYLGGQEAAGIPPEDLLVGDSSTVDSEKYLPDAPVELQQVEVDDSRVAPDESTVDLDDNTPAEVEGADAVAAKPTDAPELKRNETEVEPDQVSVDQIELVAAVDPVESGGATPDVAAPSAGVCPPLARPLKSLQFSDSGSLDDSSVAQLRALAGTLARRDNLIARIALPQRAGASIAAQTVVTTMVAAEPAVAGRVVADVVPNLPVAVFETYRIALGC